MKNSITVVVPVYNVEPYLEDCLNSLVNQTAQADEIILIDDGSTDKSYTICKRYQEQYANVELWHQDNQGQGATRNRGIAQAHSEYIVFVDSDDLIRNDMIETLKIVLDKYNLDMLCYDATTYCMENCNVRPSECYIRSGFLKENVLITGMKCFLQLYPHCYSASACLSAYRKDFLVENGILFPEGILHEDEAFSFKTILSAKKIMYIAQQFYIRRYRENSIMTSKWSYKRWRGVVESFRLIWQEIDTKRNEINRTPLMTEYVCAFLQNTLRIIIALQKKEIVDNEKALLEIITVEFAEIWNKMIAYVTDESVVKWRGTLRFLEYLQQNNWEIDNDAIRNLEQKQEMFKQKYEDFLFEKVKELPLKEENAKVGIYGTGKHTAIFLKMYEKLVGSIKCDYFFIDSYVNGSDMTYQGKNLVNISDVEDIDAIIVSSFVYQSSINKKIDAILGEKTNRINLYDESDLISYFE